MAEKGKEPEVTGEQEQKEISFEEQRNQLVADFSVRLTKVRKDLSGLTMLDNVTEQRLADLQEGIAQLFEKNDESSLKVEETKIATMFELLEKRVAKERTIFEKTVKQTLGGLKKFGIISRDDVRALEEEERAKRQGKKEEETQSESKSPRSFGKEERASEKKEEEAETMAVRDVVYRKGDTVWYKSKKKGTWKRYVISGFSKKDRRVRLSPIPGQKGPEFALDAASGDVLILPEHATVPLASEKLEEKHQRKKSTRVRREGEILYLDGTYQGPLDKNGDPHGEGIFENTTLLYKGGFKHGLRHGAGEIIHKDEVDCLDPTEIVRFEADEKISSHRYIRFHKGTYKGFLDRAGKPHGSGIFEDDAVVYTGKFFHGTPDGIGMLKNKKTGEENKVVFKNGTFVDIRKSVEEAISPPSPAPVETVSSEIAPPQEKEPAPLSREMLIHRLKSYVFSGLAFSYKGKEVSLDTLNDYDVLEPDILSIKFSDGAKIEGDSDTPVRTEDVTEIVNSFEAAHPETANRVRLMLDMEEEVAQRGIRIRFFNSADEGWKDTDLKKIKSNKPWSQIKWAFSQAAPKMPEKALKALPRIIFTREDGVYGEQPQSSDEQSESSEIVINISDKKWPIALKTQLEAWKERVMAQFEEQGGEGERYTPVPLFYPAIPKDFELKKSAAPSAPHEPASSPDVPTAPADLVAKKSTPTIPGMPRVKPEDLALKPPAPPDVSKTIPDLPVAEPTGGKEAETEAEPAVSTAEQPPAQPVPGEGEHSEENVNEVKRNEIVAALEKYGIADRIKVSDPYFFAWERTIDTDINEAIAFIASQIKDIEEDVLVESKRHFRDLRIQITGGSHPPFTGSYADILSLSIQHPNWQNDLREFLTTLPERVTLGEKQRETDNQKEREIEEALKRYGIADRVNVHIKNWDSTIIADIDENVRHIASQIKDINPDSLFEIDGSHRIRKMYINGYNSPSITWHDGSINLHIQHKDWREDLKVYLQKLKTSVTAPALPSEPTKKSNKPFPEDDRLTAEELAAISAALEARARTSKPPIPPPSSPEAAKTNAEPEPLETLPSLEKPEIKEIPWSSTATYYGEVNKQDEADGEGKITLNDGSWCEGTFKDGDFLKGTGVIKELDGSGEYTGELAIDSVWRDIARDGRGIFTHADGRVYDGEWKQGKFQGENKIRFPNGDYIWGTFEEGEYKGGTAKFTYDDGTIYEGDINEKNERHGLGTYYFSKRDDQFVPDYDMGIWEHDNLNRRIKNRMTLDDGRTYEGEVNENNMPHGMGILWDQKGNVIHDGEWKDGQEVFAEKKEPAPSEPREFNAEEIEKAMDRGRFKELLDMFGDTTKTIESIRGDARILFDYLNDEEEQKLEDAVGDAAAFMKAWKEKYADRFVNAIHYHLISELERQVANDPELLREEKDIEGKGEGKGVGSVLTRLLSVRSLGSMLTAGGAGWVAALAVGAATGGMGWVAGAAAGFLGTLGYRIANRTNARERAFEIEKERKIVAERALGELQKKIKDEADTLIDVYFNLAVSGAEKPEDPHAVYLEGLKRRRERAKSGDALEANAKTMDYLLAALAERNRVANRSVFEEIKREEQKKQRPKRKGMFGLVDSIKDTISESSVWQAATRGKLGELGMGSESTKKERIAGDIANALVNGTYGAVIGAVASYGMAAKVGTRFGYGFLTGSVGGALRENATEGYITQAKALKAGVIRGSIGAGLGFAFDGIRSLFFAEAAEKSSPIKESSTSELSRREGAAPAPERPAAPAEPAALSEKPKVMVSPASEKISKILALKEQAARVKAIPSQAEQSEVPTPAAPSASKETLSSAPPKQAVYAPEAKVQLVETPPAPKISSVPPVEAAPALPQEVKTGILETYTVPQGGSFLRGAKSLEDSLTNADWAQVRAVHPEWSGADEDRLHLLWRMEQAKNEGQWFDKAGQYFTTRIHPGAEMHLYRGTDGYPRIGLGDEGVERLDYILVKERGSAGLAPDVAEATADVRRELATTGIVSKDILASEGGTRDVFVFDKTSDGTPDTAIPLPPNVTDAVHTPEGKFQITRADGREETFSTLDEFKNKMEEEVTVIRKSLSSSSSGGGGGGEVGGGVGGGEKYSQNVQTTVDALLTDPKILVLSQSQVDVNNQETADFVARFVNGRLAEGESYAEMNQGERSRLENELRQALLIRNATEKTPVELSEMTTETKDSEEKLDKKEVSTAISEEEVVVPTKQVPIVFKETTRDGQNIFAVYKPDGKPQEIQIDSQYKPQILTTEERKYRIEVTVGGATYDGIIKFFNRGEGNKVGGDDPAIVIHGVNANPKQATLLYLDKPQEWQTKLKPSDK